MKEKDLLRYSRSILLAEIDYKGQELIHNSCCLIVGLGGLGSAAAYYLASSGVKHLVLCDFDTVELSNLQRQIIHNEKSIGMNKAESAKKTLLNLNSDLIITTINQPLNLKQLISQSQSCDLIIDCSDNFKTRYLLNHLSLSLAVPLVSGAAIRAEGQVSVFNLHYNSACYQCLFDDPSIIEDQNCSNSGVFPPLVGIVGSIQANEALKILSQSGDVLDNKLFTINSLTMQTHVSSFSRDSACPCH